MKLMEGLKILQEKYPEYIILVKNGLFYNAIGKDAILLSKEFKLTKICFSKQICKIGINENKINDFIIKLTEKDYKYIVYNYKKGEFKDIDEQFIEEKRKDEGKKIKKEQYVINCLCCDYFEKVKQRESICKINNKIEKNLIDKKKISAILKKKNELEIYLQSTTKIINEYLNSLIDEYLIGDEIE